MNRFTSAKDESLFKHLPKDTDLCRLEFWLESEVWFFEISENTIPLETLRLFFHCCFGKGGRLLSKSHWSKPLSFFGFHRLEDFEFDGQTVTIPTGDVMDLLSVQCLFAIDKIFENFVQRVPAMETSVRIRRSIVQNETVFRCFRGCLREFVVQPVLLPEFLDFWFSLDRICSLTESCLGEHDGRSEGILWFLLSSTTAASSFG
mmetsp:Transcript_19183/g.41683  ORF Transcript_19183/g.41683 Transcript_19183/m.41683 type:complete len:204 (-) Transcript_19183:286-897(-)